jgi:hypothetical protein
MITSIGHNSLRHRRDAGLQSQLVALADLARAAGRETSTGIATGGSHWRAWLEYLAENLDGHLKAVVYRFGEEAGPAASVPSTTRDEPTLRRLADGLERVSNDVRDRLVEISPETQDAALLDDLLRDLEMHWWVSHRLQAGQLA